MKPIRQTRNEVEELIRRGGKTVQQDNGRLRRVPGLAVGEPEARNVGGLEVHKSSFSSVGIEELCDELLRERWIDEEDLRGLDEDKLEAIRSYAKFFAGTDTRRMTEFHHCKERVVEES